MLNIWPTTLNAHLRIKCFAMLTFFCLWKRWVEPELNTTLLVSISANWCAFMHGTEVTLLVLEALWLCAINCLMNALLAASNCGNLLKDQLDGSRCAPARCET